MRQGRRSCPARSSRQVAEDVLIGEIAGGLREREHLNQQSNAIWSPDGAAIAYYASHLPLEGWVIRQTEPGAWGAPVKQCSCVVLGWVDDRTIVVWSRTPVQGRPGVRMVAREVVAGAEQLVLERPVGPDAPLLGTLSADRRSLICKTIGAPGRPDILSVPVAGGTPRRLLRFTNPDRPSYHFAVEAWRTHLHFTINDRQSDIAVAELVRR